MRRKIKGFYFIEAVHRFLTERSITSLTGGITSLMSWRTTASLMVGSSRRSTSIIKSWSRARLHQKVTRLLIGWFILLVFRINHLKEAWNWKITSSHII